MNRGVIIFTKDELLELCKNYDFTNQEYNQLGIKLRAGLTNIQDPNNISIFVSQDELEFISDEIGFISPDNNPTLSSVMNKINLTISKLEGN